MKAESIKSRIEVVPDFPKPGVSFKDIAPLLKNHFSDAIDVLEALYTKEEWEKLQHFFTSQKLDSDAESMKEYLMKKFNLTKDVATNIAQDLKKKMNE